MAGPAAPCHAVAVLRTRGRRHRVPRKGVARGLYTAALRAGSGRADAMVAFIELANRTSWRVHVDGFGMTPMGSSPSGTAPTVSWALPSGRRPPTPDPKPPFPDQDSGCATAVRALRRSTSRCASRSTAPCGSSVARRPRHARPGRSARRSGRSGDVPVSRRDPQDVPVLSAAPGWNRRFRILRLPPVVDATSVPVFDPGVPVSAPPARYGQQPRSINPHPAPTGQVPCGRGASPPRPSADRHARTPP